MRMCVEAVKVLVLDIILCSLVKAHQPDGYLGCFDECSLINETQMCRDFSYTGDTCKDECKCRQKRYAATKHGVFCSCGDDFHKDRNSTGCDWVCLIKKSEMCGSILTISLYDTLMSKTGTCKNISTCNDSDETTTELPTTQVSSFTGSFDSKTTLLINADKTTTTNKTWLIDNFSARDSTTITAVYISVPVITLIIVVVGVVIFLIKRRKRQLMKQDSNDICNSSNGNKLSFSDENKLKYNDNDKIQLEITSCHKDATENAMSETNGSALKEISLNYHTIDPPYHSGTEIQTEIPVDEDDYEHIKSTTNVVFDPTYSHTTDLQTKHTSDEMYSQVNKVAKKSKLNSNTNQNNETYDKLKNNATMGTPKPEVHSSETDETYNTVSKVGKTTSRGDSNTSSSLNEPDYDHIDSKDL